MRYIIIALFLSGCSTMQVKDTLNFVKRLPVITIYESDF